MNTLGENADTPEVAALKQECNDKLREVAEKTNEAIQSLTGGLLDTGLWAHGEIITITSQDFLPSAAVNSDKDWGFRHHLGTVPQRALQFIPLGPIVAGSSNAIWPMLRMGAAAWTDTYVYFRPSDDIAGYSDTDTCIIEVLLIP